MRYSRCAGAACLALALGGCVIPQPDATREVLDEDTGTTVVAMGTALEFYAPRPELGLQAASFAHLGAFESNRMGVRRLLLWLSVLPGGSSDVDAGTAANPQALSVMVGDGRIEPPLASADARELGLARAPFKRPADWARDAYFDVTLAELRRIEGAAALELMVTAADGSVQRYEVWKPERASLSRFIEAVSRPQPP
jgi:hypothetical protein